MKLKQYLNETSKKPHVMIGKFKAHDKKIFKKVMEIVKSKKVKMVCMKCNKHWGRPVGRPDFSKIIPKCPKCGSTDVVQQ